MASGHVGGYEVNYFERRGGGNGFTELLNALALKLLQL